jgi:hypothetical protein
MLLSLHHAAHCQRANGARNAADSSGLGSGVQKDGGRRKPVEGHYAGCAKAILAQIGEIMRRGVYERHGQNGSPTHRTWSAMRSRCLIKGDAAFSRYGGRGIRICKQWDKFSNFLADMGEKPLGKTLDRKDTNGNYEPNNCQWSTPLEQQNNMRRNRRITYEGKTLTMSQWAREKKLAYCVLCTRLRRGWSMARALETP